MKKRDEYDFNRGLKMSRFVHPRVTHGVNKNKRLVKESIDDMEKHIAQSDEFKKFIKEREDLAKEHCAKEANGDLKMNKKPTENPGENQMVYDITGQNDKTSVYCKALTKLEKKHKEAIDIQEEKVKKYTEEFLDDPTEFKPFMIPLTLMEAHEKCPQAVMDLIFWMVDDTK